MPLPSPRIPVACPPGFLGRYTVSPGDTIFRLSLIFRVRLDVLIANNPHIPDPNIIFPGDVLCVPAQLPIPYCVVLQRRGRVPFATLGTALVNFGPRGGQAVSVMATLPQPAYFGNYDGYVTTIFIHDIGGFGTQLSPTVEDPPTWAARIELPTVVSITPEAYVVVEPFNTITGISGPVILEGSLIKCWIYERTL